MKRTTKRCSTGNGRAASSGPQELDETRPPPGTAATPSTARASAEGPHPRGAAEPELEGHAAAHRIADHEGAVEGDGVEEARAPPREERRPEPPQRLVRLAESGQVGDEHVVVARQIPHHRKERRARRTEPVQEHDRGHPALSRLQVEGVDVGRAHAMAPRRARVPLGGVQQVVELHRQGDVPAEQQAALEERLDPRHPPVEHLHRAWRRRRRRSHRGGRPCRVRATPRRPHLLRTPRSKRQRDRRRTRRVRAGWPPCRRVGRCGREGLSRPGRPRPGSRFAAAGSRCSGQGEPEPGESGEEFERSQSVTRKLGGGRDDAKGGDGEAANAEGNDERAGADASIGRTPSPASSPLPLPVRVRNRVRGQASPGQYEVVAP